VSEEPSTGLIATICTSAGVAITAAGAFALNYLKHKGERDDKSDDRADKSYRERVDEYQARVRKLEDTVTATQEKHLECEKLHAEVSARVEVVEERSAKCEEDRANLFHRIKCLEETVKP
jgi:chromosome segregation ATPase